MYGGLKSKIHASDPPIIWPKGIPNGNIAVCASSVSLSL